MYQKKNKTRRIVLVSMLSGILLVMSFTPLGYLRMTRNSYDPAMVENFRSQVKRDIVPLVCKLKQQQADKRRQDIIDQLKGPFGIAYIDGTERVTQLNRPIENNLMKQIEYLTNMLYSQLGMTPSVFDGTADEKAMLNYNNRTIEPIVYAIIGAMKRSFLSKTARTQGQTVMAFRDPFKLVPIDNIAEIADKFTRNEVLTSNEIRQIIGFKPADDPKADQLVNSNIAQPAEAGMPPEGAPPEEMTSEDVTDESSGDIWNVPVSEIMSNS